VTKPDASGQFSFAKSKIKSLPILKFIVPVGLFCGDSVFILREDKDDPVTEARIPLHPGMQIVIDTERLYHVVWHPGPRPRYALITSWESDDMLDSWIAAELTAERKLATI